MESEGYNICTGYGISISADMGICTVGREIVMVGDSVIHPPARQTLVLVPSSSKMAGRAMHHANASCTRTKTFRCVSVCNQRATRGCDACSVEDIGLIADGRTAASGSGSGFCKVVVASHGRRRCFVVTTRMVGYGSNARKHVSLNEGFSTLVETGHVGASSAVE